MTTHALPVESGALSLELVASFSGMRALAWHGDVLCASRGYELYSGRIVGEKVKWNLIGEYRPPWWRSGTSRVPLASRLVRDGFHALARLQNGTLIAAVPGAIATLRDGEHEFAISHRLLRGTRPLHIASTPDGRAFWGEYFDNAGAIGPSARRIKVGHHRMASEHRPGRPQEVHFQGGGRCEVLCGYGRTQWLELGFL